MRTATAALVKFTVTGSTVYWFPRTEGTLRYGQSETHGYSRPENPPQSRDGEIIPDGTPVLDIREAVDTDEGFRWVFAGPLLDSAIPDGDITRCPQPSPLLAGALAEACGEFALLLAKSEVNRGRPEPGPLDQVGIRDYVAGWKAHGARVGRYESGSIVWQD